MKTNCDILVIGASTNGMALASRLASCGRKVIVLEKDLCPPCCEDALTDPLCVGNPQLRAMIGASAELLASIPGTMLDKETLHLFGAGCLDGCTDAFACCINSGARAEQLDGCEVSARYSYLCCNDEHCAGAIRVKSKMISGAALYRHCRRVLERCCGRLCFGEAILRGNYGGGAWTVETNLRTICAHVVVNCAGASADDVARRCDVRRLGLTSCVRTCVNLAMDDEAAMSPGPCIFWQGDPMSLYCDFAGAGRVQISTGRQRPCGPCSPEPDGEDIGMAIVCFEERTLLSVCASSGPASACLHTYSDDGHPVVGWTRETPGFFWCAAMGDFGSGCAMAVSAMAADMIQNRSDAKEVIDRYGVRRDCVCPDRLGYIGVVA